MTPTGWAPHVRALLVGAALVLVMTYPTVPRATTVGRLDTNDGMFSIWNVGWIGHALSTDPRTLLDANIFYPHRGTLAYSELNLVAGVLGWPWYAATGSALAALNGSVATALLLSFVAMAALVRRLTASEPAGLVAGVAFTFSPYVSARTPHVQLLMIFVLPLLLVAGHRLADRPGVFRGCVLGAALALAALASGYYGIYGGVALAIVMLGLAQRAPRYWASLGIAVVSAALLLWPVLRVYERARAASGAVDLARSAEEARGWSANLSSYLASGAFAHHWWMPALHAWRPWIDALFPGIGVLALAAAGVAALRRAPSTRRLLWAYLAVTFAGLWASFGPDAGFYRLVMLVPGASLLRAPARFGVIVVLGLSVLAGFGVASLSRRRPWVGALLVVVLAAELAVKTDWGWPSWPLRTTTPPSVAYQTVAQRPRGVFVEFPFPYVRSNYHNHGSAMYWSTYHWQPMVNGYSDLVPPDFDAIARPINFFPDPASFAIMHERQVRYVLWHIDYYRNGGREEIAARIQRYAPYLRPIVQNEDEWLFEIVGWPPAGAPR
ncbi:MAG: hypothetical protein IT184_00755 [Acidobacteria bacterium]|nr:hypothetical protein [Acidobacteriota bacterium]